MTVSDTHADTIREALGMAARMGPVTESEYVIPASTALDALVAERARERARADRAEAALAVVAEILSHPRFDADDEIVILRKEVRGRLSGVVTGHALANRIVALSAGSGGRETMP